LALILMPTPGRCDVILDWNVIMQATVSSLPPFPQARFAAITQLAVFEAVNAIKGDYKPYLGTIQASPFASAGTAAITAAHAVLKNYFPANAVSLDAAEFNSLRTAPPRRPELPSGRRHDRRTPQRRLGSGDVLHAVLVKSRRMATDPDLRTFRRRILSMAKRESVCTKKRRPDLSSAPPPNAATVRAGSWQK
jgi:hypothetical protein